jgi:hypothetical protein
VDYTKSTNIYTITRGIKRPLNRITVLARSRDEEEEHVRESEKRETQ